MAHNNSSLVPTEFQQLHIDVVSKELVRRQSSKLTYSVMVVIPVTITVVYITTLVRPVQHWHQTRARFEGISMMVTTIELIVPYDSVDNVKCPVVIRVQSEENQPTC